MKNISLDEVSLKNAIRLMMADSEVKTFKDVAETLDISKSTFQSSLDNDALRVRDLHKIAKLFGYKVCIVKE